MTRYVPDISTHRWVIISPGRLGRPGEDGKIPPCPFCEGHEGNDEVMRYGEGEPNTPGWHLRVIKNKFPITDIHEVIIHSPHHDRDIESLTLNQVELVLRSYRDRYNEHKDKGQVLIFCNHGEHAGASLQHPHSQLVVLPNQINIDALIKEPLQNIVIENTFFMVYCPDFSQWPYEVWIAPKIDGHIFGEINDAEIEDLADIMQKIIKKLDHLYKTDKPSTLPFGYNYYIYPKENWYIRIIPRFVHRAGFELGTGLSVNIVDPHDASERLK
jgi:UDPglucose--hexose-1-phosphate uridylyltransferase